MANPREEASTARPSAMLNAVATDAKAAHGASFLQHTIHITTTDASELACFCPGPELQKPRNHFPSPRRRPAQAAAPHLLASQDIPLT